MTSVGKEQMDRVRANKTQGSQAESDEDTAEAIRELEEGQLEDVIPVKEEDNA